MEDQGLEGLRRHVRAAEDMNMLQTAAFFGEKIVCLPGAKDADVYKLAHIYYKQRHFKRALQTLQKAECATSDTKFRLLCGQCLAECNEYDQCLALLGDDDLLQILPDDSPDASGDEIDPIAAMSLLRGRVYDMQQNRIKAAICYQDALRRDVKCYEAFEKLVDSHMLSAGEQRALLASLRFRESQVWLKGMYRARLHKYDLAIQHPLSLAEVQDDNMDESGSSSQGKRDASSSSSSDAIVRARSLFANSVDAKTIVAEFHYYHNNFAKCHELTQAILEADSHAHACLAYHLSSLVELKSSRELFIDAHRLVDSFPDTAEAWYAVGCYYYLCNKFEKARINFLKATSLNPYFAPAWLGYGHTFAAQDESDQALAAYRTASRFFSGCHLPPLCIGMEYAKTGNLQVSDQFLTHTLSICALDPLVFNEIGVLRYLQGNYEEAAEAFEKVMDLSQAHLVSQTVSETVEASLFNLGHCYRKLQRLNEAVEMYSRALRCKPNKASTYTAMAFTYHLLGNFDTAINYYHKALGICPEDTLTTEMLERALKHAAENSSLA